MTLHQHTFSSNELPETLEVREYLENIISLMPGHVYWKDLNGVFQGCNDLQAKSAKLSSRKEIIGKTDYDMPWKEQADILRVYDLEVMSTGIPKTIEEPSTLADGTEAIFLSKKVPHHYKGKIIGIVGISFDITEQKRLEKELQETLHKLDGMTVVAASIAHELRTPLATLSASIHNLREVFPDLLEGYRLAKEAGLPVKPLRQNYLDLMQDTLKSMEKETRAAFTFIEILLMNVKPALDEGEEKVFSIHKIITETIDRYPFSFNQKNLMQWKNQESNDFKIKGKAILITHILFNLIKNALYYIEKAGKGEITISLKPGDKFNTLYVKDTGTGMPPEVVSHVFDRFFSRTPHGAGIGLTYCKMAMETFHGNITCQSVDGEYTLFTLTFPAKFEAI